jgi:hypothetical protein
VRSTEHAADADSLVRDADRALYWAKDSERNMTFLYTDEARVACANGEPPNQIVEPVP